MKTMFFASATTLLVLGGAANAKSAGLVTAANQASEAVASTGTGKSSQASNSEQMENPTGLPSYELRRDGLMINGLLPANGWQC